MYAVAQAGVGTSVAANRIGDLFGIPSDLAVNEYELFDLVFAAFEPVIDGNAVFGFRAAYFRQAMDVDHQIVAQALEAQIGWVDEAVEL